MELCKDKQQPSTLGQLCIEWRARGIKSDMTPAIESHSLSLKFIVEGKTHISPTLKLFPCDTFPKSTQIMFHNNYRTA